jgi:hypothetical protein
MPSLAWTLASNLHFQHSWDDRGYHRAKRFIG